jgi:S-adenosylmethionine synthetase
MRHLDVERHVRIVSRLRPGSADLTGLFSRAPSAPACNDTSCGVGFAPLTDLERVVLRVERSLNSAETKAMHPAIGEDIKVMGRRKDGRIALTIGCALVAKYVDDTAHYSREKATVLEIALAAARAETSLDVDAVVNAADDEARGELYLTVTGTSAEAGDDGEVGRGNRANGLITPYRPMTLEAAAGKNPVTHVGKLYNLLATTIAQAVAAEWPQARNVSCLLLSQIGRPVVDPWLVDVRITTEAPLVTMRAHIDAIVREQLGRIDALRSALLAEEISVY